jgi:hypothetical protein
LALAGCLAGGSAAAEMPRLADEPLRQYIAGKTIHLDTRIGTIPITYNPDGTLVGRVSGIALSTFLGSETDRGRWQVQGEKICQKFFRWLSGEMACVVFRQEGRRIAWRRDDGMTGTATIAANDQPLPPPAAGLGARIPPPAAPMPAQLETTRGPAETAAGTHETVPQDVASASARRPAEIRTAPASPIAAAPSAEDDMPPLLEPPRRWSSERPRVMLAAASLGNGAGFGALRRSEPTPVDATPSETPAVNISLRPAIAHAHDLAMRQVGQSWCRVAEPEAQALPTLIRMGFGAEPPEADAIATCMSSTPHLLEDARAALAN